MFALLYSKEIKSLVATFKFSALLISSTALIVISAWVLGSDYQRRLDTYNRLADEAALQAAENYIPSRVRPVVHRPPSPMGIFVQGEEKRLGNSIEISRWRQPVKATDSLTDNMLLVAMPSFDLLAIFTLVISLFALLISYDMISGDREAGTLKLVVLTGPRRPLIYVAKFLAGITVLLIPLLLGLFMSLLVLNVVHGMALSAAFIGGLIAMLFTGLIFSGVFLALGLLTSILVRRSSTALVFSLFIWTVLTLLVPATGNNLATALHPLPSPREIADFEQRTMNEINQKKWDMREEKWDHAGSGWGSWNIGGQSPFLFDAPPESWRDTMAYIRYYEPLMQERADSIFNLQRRHLAEKRKQLQLSRALQSISPAYHLRRAMSALAATGYETHAQFLEDARRYRQQFLSTYRDRGLFDSNVIGLFARRNVEDVLSEAAWEERREYHSRRIERGEDVWDVLGERNFDPLPADFVPTFTGNRTNPNPGVALEHAAILAAALLLLLSAGFVLFLRYDVR